MKVSIIVPVYQVERYLRACIESVLCQTHREWELILVEDGSPDRCGVICDEYAKNDARITVMHKENGGLSSARNAGLCRATGEYILFLDGDDFWAEPEGLARLIPQLTSDVVVFGFSKWYEPNGAERGRWIGPDIAEGCRSPGGRHSSATCFKRAVIPPVPGTRRFGGSCFPRATSDFGKA